MSRVSSISGWVELDGYAREHNEAILSKVEYEEYQFPKMFTFPKETGTKNPDYLMFGASINFLALEDWLDRFKELIKNMKGFSAFAFISHGDGDELNVYSWKLDRDGTGIKGEQMLSFPFEISDLPDYDYGGLFAIISLLSKGDK